MTRKILSSVICFLLVASTVLTVACATGENPGTTAGGKISGIVTTESGIVTTDSGIDSGNIMDTAPDSNPAQSGGEIELTAEQIAQLEALREEGNARIGTFLYQEKVITGEIDPSAPRLDLDTALSVIAASSDSETILEEFRKIQKYPDFIGGSGVTLIEYWVSGNEEEKILIILEQGQIYYEVYDADGVLVSFEQLFGKGF